MMFLPYQELLLLTLVLSFVSSLVYRIFNKPGEMHQIKKDMQFYRDKSKEAQKAKDMKKANEYMSEMMKLSQKQMRINMKPMLISLAIVYVAFIYLSATYGGADVSTAASGTAATGHFAYGDFNHSIKVDKTGDAAFAVVIDANDNSNFADDAVYANGELARVGGSYWAVNPVDLNRTRMDLAVKLPFTMPLLGWTFFNWAFWYILIFIASATALFRKMLGIE